MGVAPNLDWSKQHVFRVQKPTIFDPNPDPDVCACGLSRDHAEHIPEPPKTDSEAFMRRKRIKDFLDRHGTWRGEQRILQGRNGGREITYTHAAVDAVPDDQLAQEMIDILWAHCDKGICRGCSADIFWIRNDSAKAVPYSRAGVVHFQDCPVRQQFKKGR